jgi:tetratricopeptide (TPR) repeat protein
MVYLKVDEFKGHEYLLELLELYPDFSKVISELVIIVVKYGDYKEAINLLNKQIRLDSTDSDTYYFIGKSYLALNEYDSADKYFDKALEFGRRSDFYIGKAQIQTLLYNDENSAEKYYLKAIEISKNNPVPFTKIGKFYLDCEKFKDAEFYSKKSDSIKRDIENSMTLILSLISQKKFDEALAFISDQGKNVNSHEMIYNRMLIYHLTNQKEKLQIETDNLILNTNEADLIYTIQQLKKVNIYVEYHPK